MASITFEGPSPTGEGRSTTIVEVSDTAFLAVVQAICASEGYSGSQPGLYVIKKTVDGWTHATELFNRNQARIQADLQVDEALVPLKESISYNLGEYTLNNEEINNILNS